MKRWLVVVGAMVIGVGMGMGLGLAWRTQGHTLAWWGAPQSESFADDSWRSRWRIAEGTFVRRDSQLVTTGAAAHRLLWRQRVDGGMVVDYDAEILPGASPCDLSLIFARDLPKGADQDTFHDIPLYHVQIGAFDAAYSAIMYGDGISRWDHLAVSDFRPQAGVRYHVRVEIVDHTITVSVDGREILRHEDVQPFNGGWFMLYSYYPGKAFTDIAVRALEMPERLPACALGDTYAADGNQVRARREFARAARRLAGSSGEAEARCKLGMACEALGDHAAADAAWIGLPPGIWREQAQLAQLGRQVLGAGTEGCEAALRAMLAEGDADTRHRVAQAWSRWAQQLRTGSPETLERLLELRERLLPGDAVSEYTAAELLFYLQRPEDVLTRFPRQRNPGARALFQLGRPEEVLERFADQRGMVVRALLETGQPDEALARYPEDTWLASTVLLMHGDAAGADGLSLPTGFADAWVFLGDLERAAKAAHRPAARRALAFLGRYDEGLRLTGGQGDLAILAAAAAGDDVTVLSVAEHAGADAPYARAFVAVGALQRGEAAPAAALASATSASELSVSSRQALALSVLLPAAWRLSGRDAVTWDALLALAATQQSRLGQRPRHWLQYLAGSIDEAAFLAQPVRLYAPADLLLLRAIRNEGSDPSAARTDYHAWLAIPPWQRSETPDPLAERFVHWRLAP